MVLYLCIHLLTCISGLIPLEWMDRWIGFVLFLRMVNSHLLGGIELLEGAQNRDEVQVNLINSVRLKN